VVTIEGFGLIVFGVYYERVHGDLGASGAQHRIPQQGSAKLAPAKRLIHGQATKPGHRDRGVTGKPPGKRCRQLAQGNAGGREGVVTSNPSRSSLDRHIASRHAATYVLGHLLPKVPIERVRTTREPRPIVLRTKGLDSKGRPQGDS